MKIRKNEYTIWIEDASGIDLYSIDRASICEFREPVISEHISQLMEQSWLTPDVLYNLAVYIEEDCPNNVFDWLTLFIQVERKDFLTKVTTLYQTEHQPGVSLFQAVELGRDLSEQEEETIREYTIRKIEDYGLT